MMTFYLGKEYTEYEEKWDVIYDHYKNQLKKPSGAAVFRRIVDVLYKEITRVNSKKEGK